jgi:hypothetical protein
VRTAPRGIAPHRAASHHTAPHPVRTAPVGQPERKPEMTVFLLGIIVAMVLGLIGAVAGGLGWLLAVAVALFVADLLYGLRRLRRTRRHHVR